MEEETYNISSTSILFAILSIISPIVVPFVLNKMGGQVSVILAFIALTASFRDPSEKQESNMIFWLVVGIVSYIVAMWTAFNAWKGNFMGVLSSFLFLGYAIFLNITKTERKGVKILAFVLIALVIIHLIFSGKKILTDYYLLQNLKRSFGI